MGDAAGEPADRFHLLRLPELLLEQQLRRLGALALADVARDHGELRPGAPRDLVAQALDPEPVAGGVLQPHLAQPARAPDQAVEPVVGVDELRGHGAEQGSAG